MIDKQVSSANYTLVSIVYENATRTVCLRQVSQAYLVSEPDPADRRLASFFRFLLLRYARTVSTPTRNKRKTKVEAERRNHDGVEERGREIEENTFRLASDIFSRHLCKIEKCNA